eukprot:4242542-Prymnesium_polylepis.2
MLEHGALRRISATCPGLAPCHHPSRLLSHPLHPSSLLAARRTCAIAVSRCSRIIAATSAASAAAPGIAADATMPTTCFCSPRDETPSACLRTEREMVPSGDAAPITAARSFSSGGALKSCRAA